MKFLGFVDGVGIYGNYVHFALVIFLVGSAFLVFLYLWKTGRLDWDEDVKYQILDQDQIEGDKDGTRTSRRK